MKSPDECNAEQFGKLCHVFETSLPQCLTRKTYLLSIRTYLLGIRPTRPTCHDGRSRDVGSGGKAGPPTAYHSESFKEVYARNLSKGQGAK